MSDFNIRFQCNKKIIKHDMVFNHSTWSSKHLIDQHKMDINENSLALSSKITEDPV